VRRTRSRAVLPEQRIFGSSREAFGRVLVRVQRALERQDRIDRSALDVSRAPRSVDAALDYAFAARPGMVKIVPNQVRSELREFLLFVQELRPRAVLEIGTALGGTLFLLTRVATPDAVLVTVDLSSPRDLRFGGGNVGRRAPLYEAFAVDQQRVRFLPGDSHTPEMRQRVETEFDGREVDLLFIDGDHSEEGVRTDYLLYRDLVCPGGAIAFHDIVEGDARLVGGVPRFWQSVRTPEAREFVADRTQGGWGIGVLRA
jgi:predicted O-methyltransferase YrrM